MLGALSVELRANGGLPEDSIARPCREALHQGEEKFFDIPLGARCDALLSRVSKVYFVVWRSRNLLFWPLDQLPRGNCEESL